MTCGIERSEARAPRHAAPEVAPAPGKGLLQAIARLALSAPRRMLAVAALVAVAAAIFGVPVAKSLCACGFEDPSSQSAKAQGLLTDKFDVGDVTLVIVVTAAGGADGAAATAAGTELVEDLLSVATRRVGDVGVDRARTRAGGAGQQGRQVRADRRRDRRRARATRSSTRRICRTGSSTTADGVTVRAGGRRHGERRDHRAVATRPAADGVAGDPASASSCWSGCSAACSPRRFRSPSAVPRSSARWRCCAASRTSPTSRSSR